MKVASVGMAILFVFSVLQGSLALGDGTLDLQSEDPLGHQATETVHLAHLGVHHTHDDAERKKQAIGVWADCAPLDKECWIDGPPGPELPGLVTTAASQEICRTLKTLLGTDLGPIEDLICADDKEPAPDPGPLPDPPVDAPELEADVDADHYLGFDGVGLEWEASFNLSAEGFTASGGAHGNASVRTSGQDPPPAEEGQLPCRDSRGCPDLVVDDSRLLNGRITQETFDSDDCAVEEGSTQPGHRRLLRFTFTAANLGYGDLIVGAPEDHPEWFEWGDCHGHWHFKSFADYRLWSVEGYLEWAAARAQDPNATAEEILDEHPHLEDELLGGHKQGFCLMDIRSYGPFPGPNYRSCHANQGISVGWADEYHPGLDGQWVDITGVEAGLYVLEAEVNPDRLFQESDYTNNAGAVFVAIPPSEDPFLGELECEACLPDLTVDLPRLLRSIRHSFETFNEGDCNIEEGNAQEGDRTLIRFDTKVSNIGNATLRIGDPEDNPDLFEWGECHGHWHFIDFVDQRVWNMSAYEEWREVRDAEPERPAEEILDENPHLRDGMVGGHKQGFCLIDIEPAYIVAPDTPSRHRSCSNQGISAGWADVYGRQLDGQFVDVTDTEEGIYILELEVNAGRTIKEGRYDNNHAETIILVP